jgi:hypothetical protein
LVNFHQLLFTTLLLLMLLLAIWGLAAAALNRSVGGSYRSTYVLAIAVFLIQDLIGIIIFFTITRPKDLLHLIYGVAPLLALGLAALFTFGLILRAASTGGTLAAP